MSRRILDHALQAVLMARAWRGALTAAGDAV